MMVRRQAFDQVGGFDEHFWMYWEDADLCRRLRSAGWGAWFCADARAYHYTGSSGQSETTIRAFHTSAARYYARHIAHSSFTATLAQLVLRARMRLMLQLHGRRLT